MLYSLIRALMFRVDPERAHDLALGLMDLGGAALLAPRVPDAPVEALGLRFPNPVGLAAGLDKNGDHIDALGRLGFGFIEVGTVTPRPQPGNERPRLFRLPRHRALINRMGFNNKGVDHLIANLQRRRYRGIVGVNIGKNRETPVENAVSDYRHCLERVYPHADYVTVNISSPNTPGLRDLQTGDHLGALLAALEEARRSLATRHGRRVPMLIKIAPDLAPEEVHRMGSAIRDAGMDGIIATNTTLERTSVTDDPTARQSGGLSGAPLRPLSTSVLRRLRSAVGPGYPLIGVGGIDCGEAAVERADAGADLVQLYTGFIYEGPALIRDCARSLAGRTPN